MSRIIYCSDVVLRVDDPEADISNITRWIHESTEFRPAYPEGCVLRQEVRKRIRKYSSLYFGSLRAADSGDSAARLYFFQVGNNLPFLCSLI